MIELLKRTPLLASCAVIFYLAAAAIALPALAPTADIKILGATTSEQEQLDNLVSFAISEADTNSLTAASYLVEDLATGQIIAGQHLEAALPVASLTKLMTIWTVLQHTDVDEVVTVPAYDLTSINPSLGLKAGDKVYVRDLMLSALIGSGNDAANLLGQYVSNKVNLPFGELMNQEAINLGMKYSRFSNPMGFDSVANYSSARDLSILVKRLRTTGLLEEAKHARQYSFTSLQGQNYSINATNKLVGQYPDLQAVKTGFTNLALGGMINILETPRTEYLLIVIGSKDRESDTLQLRRQVLSR